MKRNVVKIINSFERLEKYQRRITHDSTMREYEILAKLEKRFMLACQDLVVIDLDKLFSTMCNTKVYRRILKFLLKYVYYTYINKLSENKKSISEWEFYKRYGI